ncbi:cytochrome P450 [Muricoccus radiodurans]|uniref:cytochrome P450 n=1 Tax=Muricoccus radiodurans TaxID=2231721 RepID=UPI003CF59602
MPDSLAADLPRVIPSPVPLTGLPLLRAVLRNAVEALPPGVYTRPVVVQPFLGRDRIFLQDPDLIQRVLVTEAESFGKSDSMRRALEPALGQGILTAHGEHWRWQRRAVAPIFRQDRLRAFTQPMLDAALRRRDRWRERPSGSTVEVAQEMMRTTFDIIEETMLSGHGAIDAARVEHCIADYVESTGWSIALAMAKAPSWAPYPGRRRAARARDYLRAELLRLVEQRRRLGSEREDLIALLLSARDPETGHAMDDRDVADNLLTFIAAGHETTALALTWAFYLLALHPEAEERALAEIATATGGADPTAESLEGMPFLRAVLHEAMRLYPPVPIVSRSALREVPLGPVTVPEGAPVYFPVYAIHRHALLWHRPNAFDPDRFATDAIRARHRYAFLPFGGGPRTCIGLTFATLEAVAILATLLPAIRLRPPPGFRPELRMRITLRPFPGMPMRLERRPA